MSDHNRIDRQVAAMHRVIAARIRGGDATILEKARANLERWRQQFGGALPKAYEEWVVLLEGDFEGVMHVLENNDENSIRVRSSSPFTGILSPAERWEILKSAA
ncbi:MAG: hypothetical protein ACREPX_01850 [Rhodanobacteraceae bacterium]